MSYYYNAFVLCPRYSNASVELAESQFRHFFEETSERIIREGHNKLVLKVNDWSLRVHFNSQPYVLEESKELAQYYAANRADKDLIAACASRFEIISDLDPEGNYFNYYVFVVELLEQFAGAITFDCQVRNFV